MKKPLKISSLKITPIIHLFLFNSSGHLILFKRTCGHWGPISGEIEGFEGPKDTAFRETKEEIGLTVDHIYSTDHVFSGISPKGKGIHGITCFAPLPEKIDSDAFNFNNEISGFLWASFSDALLILRNKGFPEAVSGFKFLLARQLIERVTTA
jgi:8-oxo-dGTP pyrophosphatase MutT (NUDIX family)